MFRVGNLGIRKINHCNKQLVNLVFVGKTFETKVVITHESSRPCADTYSICTHLCVVCRRLSIGRIGDGLTHLVIAEQSVAEKLPVFDSRRHESDCCSSILINYEIARKVLKMRKIINRVMQIAEIFYF